MRPLLVGLVFLASAALARAQLSIVPATLPNGYLQSSYGVTEVPPPGVATYETVVLSVLNGQGNFTYSVASGALPPGVFLGQGDFSGTPTQLGTFNFTVEAFSDQEEFVSQSFSITVLPAIDLPVTPIIGQPFDLPLFCDPPNSYSYEMFSPPPAGLTFNALTGAISGVPTGPPGVTTAGWMCSGVEFATFYIDIVFDVQLALTIGPATLPNGNVGSTYAATPGTLPDAVNFNPVAFTLQGSSSPATFSVISGALPPGMSLLASGQLRGAPTQAGVFPFTVFALNAAEQAAEANYSITVQSPFQSSVSAQVGSNFNLPLRCPPPSTPFTYSITGTLPPGLAIDPATGTIAGIPQGPAGPSTFSWMCADGPALRRARIDITLTVLPSVSLSFDAEPGTPFVADLVFGGGAPPFGYSVVSGGLPPGILLNSLTGRLSGTPTSEGSFTFIVEKKEFTPPEAPPGSSFRASVEIVVSQGPTLSVAPEVLSLQAVADGAPALGTAMVSSNQTGAAYFLQARTTSGGRWLSANPTSGPTPKRLQVVANPAGLQPGRYSGAIELQSPDPAGGFVNAQLQVVLTVLPAAADQLTVTPSGLQTAFRESGSAQTLNLQVGNAGSGPVLFDVQTSTFNGGSWLSATPPSGAASGAAPIAVQAVLDPSGLPPGTYKGEIRVNAPAAGGLTVIPVTMTVTGERGLLQLSKTGMTFRFEQGSNALADSVFVRELLGGSIRWQASASTISGGAWLGVTPSSGATGPQSSADVLVNGSMLPAGRYFGQVAFSSDDAANSPQTATVALVVEDQGTPLPPELDEKGLAFVAPPGLQNQLVRGIAVGNPTARAQTLEITTSFPGVAPFFTATLDNSRLTSGTWTNLVIRVSALQLTPGVYRGFVDVQFSSGGPAARLDVLLVVALGAPGGPLFLTEAGTEQAVCTPSSLHVVSIEPGDIFLADLGQPVPIEAFVVDNCGNVPTNAVVTASFSNGDEPITLVRNSRGAYSGVWTPQQTGASSQSLKSETTIVLQQTEPEDQDQAQITIQANQLNRTGGLTQLGGALSVTAGVPVISPGGAVSAASFASRDPLPPGAYISIFGSNLAPDVAQAGSLPLPAELNTVSVTAAGQPVALNYVSPQQINGVLPFGLTVDTAQQIVVRHGNALSTPESVSVSQAQPAVFTQNFSGAGTAIVVGVRPDGSQFLVGPNSPLGIGDAAVIYCAGLGLVDQAVDAAAAAPGNPLARTLNGVAVTIGGVQADVFYAGLAPGFAGLYQVNATVLPGTPPGSQVPLVLTVNDIRNPAVTVAVR
jgi:uncharacterized protein (TIGR03437 family)